MREMTDWGLDELESIAWDEFGNNDDHIVPRQVTEQGNKYVTPGDTHTKLRHVENVGNSMDIRGSSSKTSFRGKEETYFCLPMKDEKPTIMEDQHSWASEDAIPASCDPKLVTHTSASASQGSGSSNKCFIMSSLDITSNLFCSENYFSGNGLSTVGTGSCSLLHDDVPPSIINVSLEDESKRKESDLVYYDLPDIGNFDEIDQIFSHCDVASGQGDTGIADELSWFSSSNTIYGSEVTFESGANVEKDQSDYALKRQVKDVEHGINMSTLMQINSSNALVGKSDLDTVSTHLKKMETQSSSGENRIQHSGYQNLLSSAVCTQAGPSQTFSKKKHLISNQQGQMDNLAHHDLLQQRTCIKFETTPSYQMLDNIMQHAHQCIERLPDQIGEPSTGGTEKIERLYHSNQLATMTAENMHQPASCMRRCHNYQHEILDTGQVDNINLEPTVEIDSSFIRESSCMMSICADDISPEASSFQQLRDVMGQLDIRTKLCIRDSLYRLARNANERNGFTSTNTCNGMNKTERGIHSTEALKGRCIELLDAETVTNPVDRSIARLLFTGVREPTMLA